MSQDTLDHLKPKGSDLSKDAQVIRIGPDAARPDGYKTARDRGRRPVRARRRHRPLLLGGARQAVGDVVLASGDSPACAMPAAAWAARSGDSVLPVTRDSLPAPIAKALAAHEKPNVYVLGPEQRDLARRSIEAAQKRKLARDGARASRARTPVENAIAFARYEQGDFGWGVVVPGYNFTLASTVRPPTPPRPRRSPPAACSPRCC